MKHLLAALFFLVPLYSMEITKTTEIVDPKPKRTRRNTFPLVSKARISRDSKQIEDGVSAETILKHIRNGNLDALERLGKINCDVHDERGITPLHYAITKANASACALLLRNKANINIEDRNGKTPLHWLCLISSEKTDWSDILAFFREYKNNLQINARDFQGRTPLHDACENKNIEAVSFLLSLKVDPNVLDKEEKYPIDYTLNIKIIHILLEAGVQPTPGVLSFLRDQKEKDLARHQQEIRKRKERLRKAKAEHKATDEKYEQLDSLIRSIYEKEFRERQKRLKSACSM